MGNTGLRLGISCYSCLISSFVFIKKETLLKEYFKTHYSKKFLQDFDSKKIPIFLEFSPDCDFVQKNRKFNDFVLFKYISIIPAAVLNLPLFKLSDKYVIKN